jgi:hypothetical protein
MPKQTLFDHPKFQRLCYLLRMPRPHVLGHLEFIWKTGYASGSEILGDDIAVEVFAEWAGERGALVKALLEVGFIDRGAGGLLEIHDLFDHAPDFVRARARMKTYRQRLRENAVGKPGIGSPRTSNDAHDNGYVTDAQQLHHGCAKIDREKRREEKREETPPPPKGGGLFSEDLPEELDTQEFRQAWQEWQQFRKDIKKKLTPLTVKKQLKQLAGYGPAGAVASVNRSIANGWQGLFEPPPGAAPRTGESTDDRLRRERTEREKRGIV